MDPGLINKLQYALKQKDYIVTISTKQFYSEEVKDFIKYIKIRHNNKVIYSSTSKIRVIKFLANILNALRVAEEDKGIVNKEDYIKASIAKYMEEERNDKETKKA